MPQKFTSGEWTGFYLESHRTSRGWMHLFLSFEDGVLKGEGTDYVGPWVAVGKYDESTGQCAWVKNYIGKHQVSYEGVCDDNGIQGQWQIFLTSGHFHIWPRSLAHFNELYLRDELPEMIEPVSSILLSANSSSEFV